MTGLYHACDEKCKLQMGGWEPDFGRLSMHRLFMRERSKNQASDEGFKLCATIRCNLNDAHPESVLRHHEPSLLWR